VSELLANPAVQAGVIPALIGLLLGGTLLRTRFLAIVPLAALLAVVALALGLSFDPMTTVRKVVVCTLAAGVVALLLEALQVEAGKAVTLALALAAAAAALWIGSRVLAQLEGAALYGKGALLAAFALAMMLGFTASHGSTLRGLVAATVLGFSAGVLGLLGASASLAFMGIGIGASCGVAVLLQMVRGRAAPAATFLLVPVLLFATLGPTVASLTSELSFYALLPLLAVAPSAALLQGDHRPVWQQALRAGVPALVPMALSLALAWFRIGGVSA
jgi:hypothetical protein